MLEIFENLGGFYAVSLSCFKLFKAFAFETVLRHFNAMYQPEYAKVTDSKLIVDFMRKHSFATVISVGSEDGVQITHLPLLVDESLGGDKLVLWGHLARANNHWKNLKKCTAVFHGPHAYVSPSVYKDQKMNVPTWNYAVVHAECLGEIFEDGETNEEILKRTVDHFEKDRKIKWAYQVPEEYRQRLVKGVVGFRFEVIELSAKFKMSQNRSPEDYLGALDYFKSLSDPNSREIVELMEKTRPSSKA
jgi:transcriptional regulator